MSTRPTRWPGFYDEETEAWQDFLHRTRPHFDSIPDNVRVFIRKQRLARLRSQAERAIKRGFKKTMVDPQVLLELLEG